MPNVFIIWVSTVTTNYNCKFVSHCVDDVWLGRHGLHILGMVLHICIEKIYNIYAYHASQKIRADLILIFTPNEALGLKPNWGCLTAQNLAHFKSLQI